MHDASSQVRVGPLLDRTDDREKDARMKLLDRRISVAPMMDWSDSRKLRCSVNKLRLAETACSSFVAAAGSL
jgi:hypothetical protein